MKIAVGILLCVVAVVAVALHSTGDGDRALTSLKCLLHGGGHCHCMDRYRFNASTTLKTLTAAQADFRANDRDGDKVAQFWRADVAGLYLLSPKGGERIKLIELSTAAADDRAVTDLSPVAVKSPKQGYWFRAILHVDEDARAPDPDRFAFCAYPDTPQSGKYIFIVDENNRIYRSEAKGRRGIDVFPTQEELKQWTKLD